MLVGCGRQGRVQISKKKKKKRKETNLSSLLSPIINKKNPTEKESLSNFHMNKERYPLYFQKGFGGVSKNQEVYKYFFTPFCLSKKKKKIVSTKKKKRKKRGFYSFLFALSLGNTKKRQQPADFTRKNSYYSNASMPLHLSYVTI